MKGKVLLGAAAGIASVVLVGSAMAQEPFDSKLQAAIFNTKLIQAVDECATATTVINGLAACPATQGGDTALNEQFSVGKLLVKSKGVPTQVLAILKSSGNGDTKKQLAGKNLRVRLTLRVTKRTSGTAPLDAVTWSDVVLTCGNTLPPVPSNGNFMFKGTLAGVAGCNLPTSLANESYQKEVVSASIIDADTGLTVAVPGVRKKP
jgi:hypothetical protein